MLPRLGYTIHVLHQQFPVPFLVLDVGNISNLSFWDFEYQRNIFRASAVAPPVLWEYIRHNEYLAGFGLGNEIAILRCSVYHSTAAPYAINRNSISRIRAFP